MFLFPTKDEIYKNPAWEAFCKGLDPETRAVMAGGTGGQGVITEDMLVGSFEAELAFGRVRAFAKAKTFTGHYIFEAVRRAKEKIHVVAWRSRNPAAPGYSCFDSDCPRKGEGTIYVNLDQLVKVSTVNPEDRKKKNVYNNFVLILHEVGHAKQFIDNPKWFANATHDDSLRDALAQGPTLMAKYPKHEMRRQNMAEKLVGNPHKAYSSAIEWENYIYHEGPICDELGLPRRIFYGNLEGFFGQTAMDGSIG
jgi:hypothetical protein